MWMKPIKSVRRNDPAEVCIFEYIFLNKRGIYRAEKRKKPNARAGRSSMLIRSLSRHRW